MTIANFCRFYPKNTFWWSDFHYSKIIVSFIKLIVKFTSLLRCIILMSQWLSHLSFFGLYGTKRTLPYLSFWWIIFYDSKCLVDEFGSYLTLLLILESQLWVILVSHWYSPAIHVWQPRSKLVIKWLLLGHFSLFQVHRYCYLDS